MKKNILPFALIAILGIALVIIMSAIGTNQKDAIQKAQDNDGKASEEQSGGNDEDGATDDPEAIFKNNCAACHGADLSGGVGPNLQKVGGELSADEIAEIVKNGKQGDIGTMPGGLLKKDEQVQAIAKWLSEKK